MVNGIAAKSNNLKASSHNDVLGFFIVSQKLFDISRRNLILDNSMNALIVVLISA
jgi:hypothetical protein